MVEIVHVLPIKGEIENIYKALTTKQGLSSWWTADANVNEKIGSVNEFGFYGHKAIHYMKVTKLKPSSEIEWVCEKSPIAEWVQTKISFTIKEGQLNANYPLNLPHLRFVQSGLKVMDDGFGAFNYNWANYLTSLKNYVETGKGNPNKT